MSDPFVSVEMPEHIYKKNSTERLIVKPEEYTRRDSSESDASISPNLTTQHCWKPYTLRERYDSVYDVLTLTSVRSSHMEAKTMSAQQIVKKAGLWVRDILSLALEPVNAAQAPRENLLQIRPPPCILPRQLCTIVVMAHMKLVVMDQEVYFFDAHCPLVRASVQRISLELKAGAEYQEAEESKLPFKLRVVEEVLKELVFCYMRRLHLNSVIVDTTLNQLQNATASGLEKGLAKMGPMRDGINDFDTNVDSHIGTLNQIISDDEEMEKLLSANGQFIPSDDPDIEMRRSVVELIFVHYRIQMLGIQAESQRLQGRIDTANSLADLALDVRRNKLQQVLNHLEIGGMALGLSTLVSGFFGMNVDMPWGIEKSYGAFWLIFLCSIGFSMLVYAALASFLSGPAEFLNKSSKATLKEVRCMARVFQEMPAIENALQVISQEKGDGNLTLQELQQILQDDGVRVEECEYFFRLLDYNNQRKSRVDHSLDINSMRESMNWNTQSRKNSGL